MPVYQIIKAVNGTFHQADSRFGSTAGRQCACNSLFSLFWSNIRSILRWNSHDLDKVLTEGNQIYKSLNTNDYLSAEDLPTNIDLNGLTSNVIFRKLIDCEATLVQDFPFLRSLNHFAREETDAIKYLMFIEGFTIAIYRTISNTISTYYVFDSHSRDLRGLTAPNGTSVLLRFDNLYELEKYIQVFYLEYRSKEITYFQIQFIEITTTENLRLSVIYIFILKFFAT